MKMAIIGFSTKEEVRAAVEELLQSEIVLFSIVSGAGSAAAEYAEQLGAPLIYVRDFEELKRTADWYLIKRSGMPNGDFQRLIMWLKEKGIHGKVI